MDSAKIRKLSTLIMDPTASAFQISAILKDLLAPQLKAKHSHTYSMPHYRHNEYWVNYFYNNNSGYNYSTSGYDDYYGTNDFYDSMDDFDDEYDSDDDEYDSGDSESDSDENESDDFSFSDNHHYVTVQTDIGWAIRNEDEYPEFFTQQLATLKPGWTTFYTDASWSEYEDYMGLAWVCPSQNNIKKFQVSSDWTSTQGEAMAINMALDFIEKSNIQKSIICSDSLGTLESLENLEDNDWADELIWDIQKYVDRLNETGKFVEFWWCPAHMGIDGNEKADEAAEDARWNGEFLDYDNDY